MRYVMLLSLCVFAGCVCLFGGCTSPYDVRVGGRVMTARPDAGTGTAPGVHDSSAALPPAELEPVDDAIVTVSPRFGSGKRSLAAHSGPVDETGAFRYTSSGESGEHLQGVSIKVTAPGFMPAERFIRADPEGRFERQDLLVVLEDKRAAVSRVQAAPPPR